MDKMNMLNEEQLENVSGGGSYASADYLPATHGAHIRASELNNNKNLYINNKFYCVRDSDPYYYMVVTLKDIGYIDNSKIAVSFTYGEKVYINEIHGGFEKISGFSVGETRVLSSKLYTFYAME